MKTHSPLETIKIRILESDKGSVFVASDFSDLGNTVNVRKSLSRLVESGLIRRVLRGVYEFPKYSNLLNEYVAPSPHSIAMAIARNFGWSVVPGGDTALNILGLSTQVPAQWIYVSDGPSKQYSFDRTSIRFNHTANKNITKLSYKTALLAQAIKAIGKERITDKDKRKISQIITPDEKAVIIAEGKYMTAWIYDILKDT